MKIKKIDIKSGAKVNIIDGNVKNINMGSDESSIHFKNPEELFNLVKGVINNELLVWINSGFYKSEKNLPNITEGLIQKTIITEMENALLRKGLLSQNIFREVEIPDGKKIDLLVVYENIKIFIETKLAKNPEIANSDKRLEYKPKLTQYLQASKSSYGIYLIFQTEEKHKIEDYLPALQTEYADLENIEIIGLNCYK